MRFATMMRSLLIGSMIVLAPGVSIGAHLTINDTPSSVSMVPDANFEFGFNAVQLGPQDWEANCSWLSLEGSAGGSAIIYFVQPNTDGLADILNMRWNHDTTTGITIATIRFESDVDGVVLSGRTIPTGFPTVDSAPGTIDPLPLFRDPATGDPVTIPSNLSMAVAFEYTPIATESKTWSAVKALYGTAQ